MKTIKIAHLYYDLMNMYGENANIRCLYQKFSEQNVNVQIHFFSVDDKIDFNKYDIYYIGTGTEESYELALNNLKKYIEEIKISIANNKYFIVTGNALALFGDLNILDFKTQKIDFRIVGNQFYQTELDKNLIIGFQNRGLVLTEFNENSLFNVLSGTGNSINIKKEGVYKNNFYGTFLIGPFLIRNPYFTDYLIKKIIKEKKIEYKKPKKDASYQAYQTFIDNFYYVDNNQ